MRSPLRFLDDPNLLGSYFAGSSWDRWRAVLKAAYGELLTEVETALFREVAGDRNPPTKQVRELVAVAGRRSGKDSIASAVATVAAVGNYRQFLRPGERATVMCLACDRAQARIILRYIQGYFQVNPFFQQYVERETDTGLELNNGVEIVVATNSFRSVRGRSIVSAVFDEAAFWRSEESANPDEDTYQAVLPGLTTIPGAMIVIISTPYRRSGLLFRKWRESYAKNDSDVLVVYGQTRLFNPKIDQKVIDRAIERDPEAAAAEWRSDLSDFLDRELVQQAVDRDVVVRPPVGVRYYAFADPSGGRGDSFAVAISHFDHTTGQAVLDCLWEKRAPFDPHAATKEVTELLKQYKVRDIVTDRYAAGWVEAAFTSNGIGYLPSERDRTAIYIDALPLFTSGRVRLIDNPRLVHQLTSLERRVTRLGRDIVDHPPGGMDDLSNATCGALVGLQYRSPNDYLWIPEDLMVVVPPTPAAPNGHDEPLEQIRSYDA